MVETTLINVKPLKAIYTKGHNRRIGIYLVETPEGKKVIAIRTKRLVDFKTRLIIENDQIYTIESFMIIHQLMGFFTFEREMLDTFLGIAAEYKGKYKLMASFSVDANKFDRIEEKDLKIF